MNVQEHVVLGPLTTFKIGGPARFFVAAKAIEDIKQSLDFARDRNQKILILGGGSNMLVDDSGFDGLVVKIELKGIAEQNGALTASAGESWDDVVAYAVGKGLWGVENLSGIPGTVGGAVVQNIGAYGAALSQTLKEVVVFDTQTNQVRTLTNAECRFEYRTSVFKEEEGRYVVLSATLVLSPEPAPNVSYKDLKARFGDSSMDLNAIRDAVLEIRRAKFPDLNVEGTAGSFFKNPILPKEQAEALKAKYPDMPLFVMPETPDIKVPLGWFLDYKHGVMDLRDVHVGGARMYEKQFLVVAAKRGTTAKEVKELISLVQKKVFDELKIKIEPEVKII